MRLIFMGTPDFAVPALDALAESGHEIVAVYTQPPRPAGRGRKARPSSVHRRAEELGLSVHCPASLKCAGALTEFAELKPDVAVVAAYGLILPRPVLEAPVHGCLNIHASLLPRWRGAAPIHRAIMAGDKETGVCIMQMDEGLDTGPLLTCKHTAITPEDTTATLHNRLSQMGADLIVTVLEKLDELKPIAQLQEGITYAQKIDKSETRIDWRRPADDVDRHIRGLSPFPGAWCMIGDERVKLLRSRPTKGKAAPGKILKGFTVACGENAVEILEAQRPGKRAMPAEEFLRGKRLPERLR